ncbi:MAG: thiamine pyrophosphate-dependent enzyme [Sphaerochaetaceae bacterium]
MKNKEQLLNALRKMCLSRAFENETEKLITKGLIHGTTHLATGQEACQVGLCEALDKKDWILSTHRCHGYAIAKDSNPLKMFAELAGYKIGLCKGLGGSMHFTDLQNYNAGSSAIVASGIPIATGIAFGLKKKFGNNCQNISVSIFGDGASSRGALHECLNMASIWDLPLLFFCENNLYGMSSSADKMISTSSIASRCDGYNIKHSTIDGNNFIKVFEEVKKARKYILEERRPYFIELLTYRQKGHSKNDKCLYREKKEEFSWAKKDPILMLENYLLENNLAEEEEIKSIKDQQLELIKEASNQIFLRPGKFLTQEEANKFVFSDSPKTGILNFTSNKNSLTYREAIRKALEDEFTENAKAFLLGEDIGLYGGCFNVTGDLYKKFPNQIIETPVSEESFVGICIGSTLSGFHPVTEIMYADFCTLISDQIINHASQLYFMTGGQFPCPLVVRCPEGSGTGHGPQHTQSPEAGFANTPGLFIVAPSSPNDAYYLLRESIKNNNPVLFFEHKLLYSEKGEIEKSSEAILGKAKLIYEGKDLTLISYSHAISTCKKAVEILKKRYKKEVTLLDLRTICPLDEEAILEAAKATGRILIVQDPPLSTSISSEVVALISENKETFKTLKTPIIRLGGKPTPVPFSKNLEKNYIPRVFQIVEKALSLFE